MNPNQQYGRWGQQKGCQNKSYHGAVNPGPNNHMQQMVFQKKEEQLQAVMQPQEATCPAQDNWQSLTVGNDGPVLAEDLRLQETLSAFVHEPMPERAIHRKGYGAFGTFTVYQSMAAYTKACFLQTPGQKVDTFTRFSLTMGDGATADTSRNVWGFATKFYTQEGVYDLLCNHIPVFWVRDAIKFPAGIYAMRPSSVSNLPCSNQFWQFVAETPESLPFVTMLYSDLGTLDDVRYLHSYSVNTYLWENSCGKQYYVRYHWMPLGQMMPLNRQNAMQLAGENPNIAGERLWNTLAQGNVVQYDLCVQLMEVEKAAQTIMNPLDATKLWPEEQYPLTHVGRLTLDRNVDCYVEQVEKAAFSPANLIEGIGLSNDRLLQGSAMIYWEAQRYRLGNGFRKLSINRQSCWNAKQISSNLSLGQEICGMVQRQPLQPSDDVTLAGVYYRGLSEEGQQHLVDNLAVELWTTSATVREQVLCQFRQADASFAQQLEERIAWYQTQNTCRA